MENQEVGEKDQAETQKGGSTFMIIRVFGRKTYKTAMYTEAR